MYCVNCGSQLPDDAKFCSKCGKPQNPEEKTKEQFWETCEIVWEEWEDPHDLHIAAPDRSLCSGRFCALAVGPNGMYIAASTPQGTFNAQSTGGYEYERFPIEKSAKTSAVRIAASFHGRYDEGADQFLRDLIEDLVAHGWEQTEYRGDRWFSHKFRRRMK